MQRFTQTLALLFALIAELLLAPQVHAGPGVWTGSGPEGGNVIAIAVSADQLERIYLSSQGGVFRSDDDGQNWLDISSGLPWRSSRHVATSDADADRVYHAIGTLLHRSSDAGESWQAPAPGWDADWGFIEQLSVDAADPDLLMASGRVGGLRRSTDGGNTWQRLDPPGQFEQHFGFFVLPDDPDTLLLVALEAGGSALEMIRSTDGGASWSDVETGSLFTITRFVGAPGGRVLAFPDLALSEDGGASWAPVALPVGSMLLPAGAAIVDGDADTWYVGGRNGLLRTNDAGQSWTVVSQGMGPAGAGGYNSGVTALALKPGSSDELLVGSQYTGFYRPANSGATWQRRNSGLRGVQIRSLAINPLNSSILYAGQGDAFSSVADNLWASFDGGVTWSPNNDGLDAGGLRGLALDPNTAANPVTTVLYGVGWSTQIFDVSQPPRPPSGGVFKSSSGGGSWSDISADFPVPPVNASVMRAVVLDPTSGSGPDGDGPLQTVYVAGNGHITYSDDGSGNPVPSVERHRIYRSDDAGATWTGADEGLPISPFFDGLGAWFHTPIQLVIDPDQADTLYVTTILSGRSLFDEGFVPDLANGIFKSTDGGANWVHSSEGLPRYDENDPNSSHWDVLALAIAPSAPNVLYAAASPIDGFRPTFLYRSDNGGDSWQLASDGIPPDIDVRWIVVDPLDHQQVYAAGGGTIDNPGSVFRSEDGGQNWVSYSIGLPADSALVLAIDRSGPNPILHAGTSTGVYSIEQVPDEDIDGVPDAIEDGAPNAGDGNGDGIPDSLQANVASLLVPESSAGLGRGQSEYLTIEVAPTGRSDDCSRVMSVHALPANSFPIDPGFSQPYGLTRFEIPECPNARVRIVYHDKAGDDFDEDWVFRIYAPTTPGDISTVRWQTLPGSSADGHTWTFDLADGELGDLRPANGRILFQGGPARIRENRIFDDRFEP